jgi:hypothetical protein
MSKNLTILSTMAAAALLLAGCASAPKDQPSTQDQSGQVSSGGLTKEQILTQSDVKGHTPVVFPNSVDQVRQAGLRALTFVGCEVKTQQPFFLSGRRPNKFGLFVGSGGETVNVYLYPQSDAATQVWVETHKSFVGLAGQQGWNKQVIDQMTQLLNATASSQ